MANGEEESIEWEKLNSVEVLTTDKGPFEEDVFLILNDKNGENGCVIPQTSEGFDALLDQLQNLPSFNNKMIIKAMISTQNNRFVCWEKDAKL
jgi:hypothetical protein